MLTRQPYVWHNNWSETVLIEIDLRKTGTTADDWDWICNVIQRTDA
jgi:hypothetical protein